MTRTARGNAPAGTVRQRYLLAVCTAALCAALSACAGGGASQVIQSNSGSSGTTVTPPSPSPPSSTTTAASFRTSEYLQSWGLDAIHAAQAYALGYSGAGVKIGIVDLNFNFSSSEVQFDPASVGPNQTAVDLYEAQVGESATTDPHGQAVAAVAAAKKNDIGIQGVAYNATVIAVDFFSDVDETTQTYNTVLYHVSDPWTYLTDHGARIINTSFGYDTSDIIQNPPVVSEEYVLAPPAQAVANGALLVASAGNNAGARPILSDQQTVSDIVANNLTNGPGAYIIAGAVQENGTIASYSNRAGSGPEEDYFMVAPGDRLVAPWTNGDLYIVSGTSFAAPMISGAAALIFQHWPGLTAYQVRDILFQSASDLGAPGVDPVYGHGLLDVYAAMQPIGTTTTAVSNGTAPAAALAGMVVGPAFGDAPQFRSALTNVTTLDSFGRDFSADLSGQVVARPDDRLFSLFAQRDGWHGAGLAVGDTTTLGVGFYADPDAALRRQSGPGAPDAAPLRDAVVQFSGIGSGYRWTAGTGLGLAEALAPASAAPPRRQSLTGAFGPLFDQRPGPFAGLSVALAPDWNLSAGMATLSWDGIARDPITNLRRAASGEEMALRFDHAMGPARASFTLGTLAENDAVLGSLAGGGLRLARGAATVWTSWGAETALDSHWSVAAQASAAYTRAERVGGSLVTALGPITSSAFSFGVTGSDLFSAGDRLAFTIHQPLRAESAPVSLVSGTGKDWNTGQVILARTQTSLMPSGRELAFGADYARAFGGWSAEASAAFRHDAGHVRGHDEADVMLWLHHDL